MDLLCIIDMQPYFTAAKDTALVNRIIDEMRIFKKQKRYIFIVEYDECGRTDVRILNELDGYTKYRIIKKTNDDGSTEILECLKLVSSSGLDSMKICGVNTWACVFDTVIGLAEKRPDMSIVVLDNLCSDECSCEKHSISFTQYMMKTQLSCNESENWKGTPKNIKTI